MGVVELTEDNAEDFLDYLGLDVVENIGRTFFRGLIALDEKGSPAAGIVWEYKNVRTGSGKESHIMWLQASDEEAFNELFLKYDNAVKAEGAVRSLLSLPADTSEKLKDMLKSKGFSGEIAEGSIIAADLSEVSNIGAFEKVEISDAVKPLKSMTQRDFLATIDKMMELKRFGTCEDLDHLPRLYFENNVSCYAEVDGQICGLFLFHRTLSGKLEVVLLCMLGKESVKILPQLIKQAAESGYEYYEPDTVIVIDRHDNASRALVGKLFPGGFGMQVFEGERLEV